MRVLIVAMVGAIASVRQQQQQIYLRQFSQFLDFSKIAPNLRHFWDEIYPPRPPLRAEGSVLRSTGGLHRAGT